MTTIAYKAFNADFTCRGFQYEVGKTYTHDGEISMCDAGFHACENPLDVLNYYNLCDSRFAVVELSGEIITHEEEDTKLCAATLHVRAELKLPDFVKAAVQWVIEACKPKEGESSERVMSSSGAYAHLASSGDGAQLASSGAYAQLASSGAYAQLASSGAYAHLASSGAYAQLASSGDGAQLASSGAYAHLASSGAYEQLASSGAYAQLASSGAYAQLASSGAYAQLASSGDGAQLASSGDGAQLASSGAYAHLASSGAYAQLASSGDGAHLASSGAYAQLASSGDGAQLASSGENGVICSSGCDTRAKVKAGTWVALAEFDDDDKCVGFATGCAGKDFPADVWVRAEDGKLVEVGE